MIPLRSIIRDVRIRLNLLGGIPEDTFTPELVRIGADLWAIASKVKILQEEAKDALRTLVPTNPGQHTLTVQGATCVITVPEPQLTLRDEVPVAFLRERLGDQFHRVFKVTETVTLRGDPQEAGLDPDTLKLVMASLDMVAHKPRVTFQNTPPDNHKENPA